MKTPLAPRPRFLRGIALSCAALVFSAISEPALAATGVSVQDPVARAQGQDMTLEALNAAFDEAQTGAETCPMLMDVVVQSPTGLALRVLAPCFAYQSLQLSYGLKTQWIRLPANGSYSAILPAVTTDRTLTLHLPDGRIVTAPLNFSGADPEAEALALR